MLRYRSVEGVTQSGEANLLYPLPASCSGSSYRVAYSPGAPRIARNKAGDKRWFPQLRDRFISEAEQVCLSVRLSRGARRKAGTRERFVFFFFFFERNGILGPICRQAEFSSFLLRRRWPGGKKFMGRRRRGALKLNWILLNFLIWIALQKNSRPKKMTRGNTK